MKIIIPIKLKPETDHAAFENWARETGLPGVRALVSVKDYQLLRTAGLLEAEGAAPYDYVGLIDASDMAEFQQDLDSESGRHAMAALSRYADASPFIRAEAVSEVI